MIRDYFKSVEDCVLLYQNLIKSYTINVKYFNRYKGYIKCEIVFKDDSVLSFSEVKDTEIDTKDKYSYHFMNSSNDLIFRYDNAKHHPELSTFPHHKHSQLGVSESSEMTIEEIMTDIEQTLTTNTKPE